jgi:hypothetical protein
MSKQSDAKEKQGYTRVLKTCGNCRFLSKEIEKVSNYYATYEMDKKLRCSIGGFAVQKMATCGNHELKKMGISE